MSDLLSVRPDVGSLELINVRYPKVDGGTGGVTIERLFLDTLKESCVKSGDHWKEVVAQLVAATPSEACNRSSYVRAAILKYALSKGTA